MKIYCYFFAIVFFFGTLQAQVNLDSGLVAYYPFNGNANDESGNGNNGTVVGANLIDDRFGNINSAYNFNGSTDYINCGNVLNNVILPLSISAWVRYEGVSQRAGIISSDENPNNSGNYYGFWLTLHTNGTVFASYGDGTGALIGDRRSVSSTTGVNLSDWSHVVWIVRGPTDMEVYINGQLSGNVYSGTGGNMSHTSWPLIIGKRIRYGENGFFNGAIDDVHVYDRSLTYGEIDSLYNKQVTSISSVSPSHPNKYALSQNYPNPFNPATTIEYALPKAEKVHLTVFNMLGQEVATLVNGEAMQAGVHSATFNAENLPSGVYYYRINAGDFSETKKMLLVR